MEDVEKIRNLKEKFLKKKTKLKLQSQDALAVNIETFPTHIAGLPVAVNISCHALRSATALI